MPAYGVASEETDMKLRSLLFVPADRPDRFQKAAASGADAIILDLEDSVAPANKAAARAALSLFLSEPAQVLRFVRTNPHDSGMIEADIAAAAGADALMLPKAAGPSSVDALRRSWGRSDCPKIIPIATETPAAIFQLGSYVQTEGLLGLTWGAEDLSAAIGASAAREMDGRYTPTFELARSLTLLAAHAAGIEAIDTVFPAISDLQGLATYASRAARDGFTGMMAIHPSQVATINAAFTPTREALDRAHRIVDAFNAAPGLGALQLDGAMLDAPHLKQAKILLSRAADRD